MEHTGDAAWFPGEVVTHNKACSLFKSVNVCLVVGIPYDGSILKGGSDSVGIGRLCVYSPGGSFLGSF